MNIEYCKRTHARQNHQYVDTMDSWYTSKCSKNTENSHGEYPFYKYIITLPLRNNENLLKYVKEKYFLLLHICNSSFPRFRRIYILCDGLFRQILWDAKIYKRCKFGKLPESCNFLQVSYICFSASKRNNIEKYVIP
jgi:hypothetical protein